MDKNGFVIWGGSTGFHLLVTYLPSSQLFRSYNMLVLNMIHKHASRLTDNPTLSATSTKIPTKNPVNKGFLNKYGLS